MVPVLAAVISSVAACGGGGVSSRDAQSTTPGTSVTTVPEPSQPAASTTVAPATTIPPSSSTSPVTTASPSTTPSSTTSTTISTTSTTSTTMPGPEPPAETVHLGDSVLGRPITAERYGEPGGRRVLVIGVIHGNEDAGTAIIDELRALGAPDDVELWLVESMNPDGQAIDDRHNANEVDLNRNFPYNWGPIGEPGDPQYAGTGPASEPETQAIVNFVSQLRPDITIWYHQDLYVIAPAEGREGRVRERYAELTGLPIGSITGGTYTGVAATWARRELEPDGSVAFIVELGETLSPLEASTHAQAVRTVADED